MELDEPCHPSLDAVFCARDAARSFESRGKSITRTACHSSIVTTELSQSAAVFLEKLCPVTIVETTCGNLGRRKNFTRELTSAGLASTKRIANGGRREVRSNSEDAQLTVPNDPRYAVLDTNMGIGQAKEGGEQSCDTLVL
ncbi:hypothetical protein TNCV_3936431 [Trichonephila clavipes]|nr:hypothetical protein TNCV_3936431 [Trichonephila clavipes]